MSDALPDCYLFPAVLTPITKEGHHGFAVEFPDLPECLVCEDDEASALASALDALSLQLFCMEENGDDIPVPTPAEKLVLRPSQFVREVTIHMPPIREKIRAKNKTVDVTITLPQFIVEWAEEKEINLSHLVFDVLDSMRVGDID